MSEPQTQLGKIIQADDAMRDAIHIAVAPVVAATHLEPGAAIGFVIDGNEEKAGSVPHPIGIVDPFLKRDVRVGERFWMFLYPNTITSLKHVWTHPAFTERLTTKQTAEAWLRDYCAQNDTEYEYLIQQATNRDDICFGNEQDDLNSDAGLRQRFWDALESVTGQKMTAEQRGTEWFRCAC